MDKPQEEINRILSNNDIISFILRFDLLPETVSKLDQIIEKISSHFDRLEKRTVPGVHVEIKEGKTNLSHQVLTEYVLIKEDENISMTFTPVHTFWIKTSAYQNNKTYVNIIKKIISVFEEVSPGIISKRIGMRFVNEFKCPKTSDIKNIYKKKYSDIIIKLLENSEKNITRAIVQQEYNHDGDKIRIQYGVRNKFYPAIISNYDLILDIDSYDDTQAPIKDWLDKLSSLNHNAYDEFTKVINSKYLEKLK